MRFQKYKNLPEEKLTHYLGKLQRQPHEPKEEGPLAFLLALGQVDD